MISPTLPHERVSPLPPVDFGEPLPSTLTVEMEDDFLPAGQLKIGANYWASHAGTMMWRDWRPEIVEQDFSRLSAAGIQLLRIFPLWPDFQPIHCLRRDGGHPIEFRHGEVPLPDDAIGRSGVSAIMLDRLKTLCDLAARHHLGLVVGLVTGWMSGRLFMPPGLDALNPITDPVSIMWQTRMITTIVGRLRKHSAVRAWDLGNECNCMGAATREQAWLWTSTLANTIRSADPSRPVVSGMHGLPVDPDGTWSIRDQGELTDILTTHPYPLFTPHCNREPMNTMRPLLHGTAETRLYADLSGRTAFVEETGNFGPAFCGEEVAADIIRAQLFSLWAHDCRAAMWWCAHDQTELEGAPYDWISMERELGLLRPNGQAKPLLLEMDKVRRTISQFPIKELPARRMEAVCILSEGQDHWSVAYTAFLLAKQAGFDLQFHYGDRPLPEAELYLLPSVKGLRALTRRREMELLQRVQAGANLYVSFDDGFLGIVTEMTGLKLIGRHQRENPCRFHLSDETTAYEINSSTQFILEPGSATVLATEENGCPVFSVSPCGQGRVYFLSVPLETEVAQKTGAFLPDKEPYWKIYETLAASLAPRRHIQKDSPWLGITEHPMSDGRLIAVLINYRPAQLDASLDFSDLYQFEASWLGRAPEPSKKLTTFAPNSATVWCFNRKK